MNRMIELKQMLSKIKDLIPDNKDVYYFDYPVYLNVGDMLIWKGAENFFKENNIKIKKRYSYHRVNKELASGKKINIPLNAIIICQGGGNFGDLYFPHHNLRNLLIEKFPENRVIILPQSIKYKDKNNEINDFNLYKNHSDLHLFVRDNNSYDIASNYLENVYLSPDTAHSLYPIKATKSISKESLYLIRNDKESSHEQANILESNKVGVIDWEYLYSSRTITVYKIIYKLHSSNISQKIIPQKLLNKMWTSYTNFIIRKAVELFSDHKRIVTSRLHGHILACLMDKENNVIDNSYGKNSSYHRIWTKDVSNTKLVKSNSVLFDSQRITN